ncbi:FG-GAP and VCBS repeat-containing protein [Streptomyces sp. enrichment culture]|uniref:FG-GAP and VCBS repeat-containing protein n=1 Tax=Streptomyces sp. enrichment culture TaxID=1795815 RepID=UPI003F571705
MTVATAVAMAATAAMAPGAPAAPGAGTAAGPAKVDFNGDGVTDVAVTAPVATVAGKKAAGYVAVTYGVRSTGVKVAHRKVYHQNSPGVPGGVDQGDLFGTALTTGDLDGDGYTDLVVGSAHEAGGAGRLTVLWGGASGLSGGTVVKGTRSDQALGEALAAGDFDGDGHVDLATGTAVVYGPVDRAAGPARTEVMNVEVGGPAEELWSRPALAAGDVNGDGIDDVVAVVSHGEAELPYHGPRLVQYFAGGRAGLTAARTLRDASTGKALDGGRAVAVGDLDSDGYADIVLGRTNEYDMDGTEDVNAVGGAVEIVRGGTAGPDTTSPRTLLHQDSPGVPGTAEGEDLFGASLSLGDVNGDGCLDLAVGVPHEAVGTRDEAGSVTVLRGTAAGLTGQGAKSFTQNTTSVPGSAEAGDVFGASVRLADTNGDGRAELHAGAPGENSGAGGVWVLPGGATQVTGTGSVSFGAASLGTVAAQAELGRHFNS